MIDLPALEKNIEGIALERTLPSIYPALRGGHRSTAYAYGAIPSPEEPSRRTPRGVDVRDLELDIEVAPDLSWHWKDEDVFEWAIAEGRIPRIDRDRIWPRARKRCSASYDVSLPSTAHGRVGEPTGRGRCRPSQLTGTAD